MGRECWGAPLSWVGLRRESDRAGTEYSQTVLWGLSKNSPVAPPSLKFSGFLKVCWFRFCFSIQILSV